MSSRREGGAARVQFAVDGAVPKSAGRGAVADCAAHSSINPFDNSMLRSGVARKVRQISLLVGLAGLVIGGVAGGLIVSMMHK